MSNANVAESAGRVKNYSLPAQDESHTTVPVPRGIKWTSFSKETLSSPARRHILDREREIYKRPEYARLRQTGGRTCETTSWPESALPPPKTPLFRPCLFAYCGFLGRRGRICLSFFNGRNSRKNRHPSQSWGPSESDIRDQNVEIFCGA
jgi:hypothetical protein